MLEKNIYNEEQLISSLKDVVKAIKMTEDPDELNKFRRIFKKAVPITMRSYVAAYLIKNAGHTGILQSDARRSLRGKSLNDSFRTSPPKIPRPKIVLPEDSSTSLFLGIGRKRGVYPKDIITLLIQGAGISREHIGDIRILDNYCFVQVMTEDADPIIEKLNNSYYRGKNLTVSHSRRPEDENYSATRSGDSFDESEMNNAPETNEEFSEKVFVEETSQQDSSVSSEA